MITGYKKKKLGHPSEKLSGDVPRASWQSVIFSEIVWPICMAIIITVAYMFVKSFPDANGQFGPSPLIRIAIIAVGPVVWNAAILIGLFFISLFLGPMMESWTKFGSLMATLAHVLGLVGLVAFFEFFVGIVLPDIFCMLLTRYSSGFWNFGTHRMPFLVSLQSLPFNVPFRKFLLLCSLPVNLNMTKLTVLGGLVSGTVAGLELQLCHNLPESLL